MMQGSKDYIALSTIAVEHYNVYVFGIARYDDGYGEPRLTRFCHRYSTDGGNRGLELLDPPPHSRSVIDADKARYHNYHNDAD